MLHKIRSQSSATNVLLSELLKKYVKEPVEFNKKELQYYEDIKRQLTLPNVDIQVF